MSASFKSRLLPFLGLLIAANAGAAPRVIRVDNSADWPQSSIGSAACAGTAAASTLITRFGYAFSGRGNTATENYNTNDYCEVANPGILNSVDYFHSDEPGLRALFAGGVGITAIRYDFLDDAQIFNADGFQWGFYTFPTSSPVTLVGLYGLDGSVNGITANDATSYIKSATRTIWTGTNGYNGQYYCFQNNAFVGVWTGDITQTSNVCLKALGVVFIGGFD